MVNDRSTDDTQEHIEELQKEHPHLRLINIQELPEDWLGKVHALHVGTQHATGEWILYTDADVHIKRTPSKP